MGGGCKFRSSQFVERIGVGLSTQITKLWTVAQFAQPFATKAGKFHEGIHCQPGDFVILRHLGGSTLLRMLKLSY